MMISQQIMSESGVHVKGLLTTISHCIKQAPDRVLSTFKLGNNVTIVRREQSMYSHDEADITIISYLLEAVKNYKNT